MHILTPAGSIYNPGQVPYASFVSRMWNKLAQCTTFRKVLEIQYGVVNIPGAKYTTPDEIMPT
jgi:hypothetical protein